MLLLGASLIISKEHLKQHRQWSPWAKKACVWAGELRATAQSLRLWGKSHASTPLCPGQSTLLPPPPEFGGFCGHPWARCPVHTITGRSLPGHDCRAYAPYSLLQAHFARGLPIPAPRREGHTLLNLGPLQCLNLTQLRRHRYDHPLLLLP